MGNWQSIMEGLQMGDWHGILYTYMRLLSGIPLALRMGKFPYFRGESGGPKYKYKQWASHQSWELKFSSIYYVMPIEIYVALFQSKSTHPLCLHRLDLIGFNVKPSLIVHSGHGQCKQLYLKLTFCCSTPPSIVYANLHTLLHYAYDWLPGQEVQSKDCSDWSEHNKQSSDPTSNTLLEGYGLCKTGQLLYTTPHAQTISFQRMCSKSGDISGNRRYITGQSSHRV